MNCIFVLGQNTQKNELLDSLFRKDFFVLVKNTAEEILENFLKENPVLVIADAALQNEIKAFLTGVKKIDIFPSVPVLILVSSETSESADVFFQPGISDIIEFPFNPLVIRRRAENLISEYYSRKNIETEVSKKTRLAIFRKNEKLAICETVLDNLIESIINNEFLVGTHAARMRRCMTILLKSYDELFHKELSAERIEDIAYASVFHDIGKILVPKEILLKDGPLTEDESLIVRKHTIFGVNLLRGLPLIHQKGLFKICQDICRHHHERWNGEGYPDGLKGDEISIASQAAGMIEAYIALQEMRPYRKACSEKEAYESIADNRCGSFSGEMLKAFEAGRDLLEEAFSSF